MNFLREPSKKHVKNVLFSIMANEDDYYVEVPILLQKITNYIA